MKNPKNIAFYAPIKPPDHPIPSGDRLIAANIVTALKLAGHTVNLASRNISYSKRSSLDILKERKNGAIAEADRIISKYANGPTKTRPDLWITYHPYCKAPDWIGPKVSSALNIPYLTIEAARTAQGVGDEWEPWRKEAQAGIKLADRHLCFKPTDRAYLGELLGSDENLMDIPAFLDTPNIGIARPASLPSHWNSHTPVLVTAGMMRKGKKDRNFFMLAEVLSGIIGDSWNLVVIGGGPEEDAIQAAFSSVPDERIHWCGQIEHAEVLKWMAAGDIFVWPGWKEPIGMVYLEAQLQGLPVIAQRSMGVPLVVQDQKTGMLSPEDDLEAMRANLKALLGDSHLRQSMSSKARANVLNNHGLERAADRINECISDL